MSDLTKAQTDKIDYLLSRCGDDLTPEQRHELYTCSLEERVRELTAEVARLRTALEPYRKLWRVRHHGYCPLYKALPPEGEQNMNDKIGYTSECNCPVNASVDEILSTPSPSADCAAKLVEALKQIAERDDNVVHERIAREALEAARKAGLV